MRVPKKQPLLIPAALLLSMALIGCEPATAPQDFSKPKGDRPTHPGDPKRGHGRDDRDRRGHKHDDELVLRGVLKKFEPIWVVSHFAEQRCDGLVAGAKVTSKGNVSRLGRTEVTASAAWDWSERPSGNYTPEGPTTGPSATILSSYPHTFCSAPRTAKGRVVLEAANGDEVRGVVTGGEVYELGFERAGDGQEQFMAVEITGGTGRFDDARGSFVIHTIVDLVGSVLIKSEILPGTLDD